MLVKVWLKFMILMIPILGGIGQEDNVIYEKEDHVVLSPSINTIKYGLAQEEIRRMNVILEGVAIDTEHYPLSSNSFKEMRSLENDIDKKYYSKFAEYDCWGGAYWYWSDGNHYFLVSYGSDRKPERNYDEIIKLGADAAEEHICKGKIGKEGDDIVAYDLRLCRFKSVYLKVHSF